MARILVVAEVTAVRRCSCRSDGDSSQPAVAAGSGFLVIELGSPTPRSHFDIAWPKLWNKNGVFGEIFGCSGHWHRLSKHGLP